MDWHQIGSDIWGTGEKDIWGCHPTLSDDGTLVAASMQWHDNGRGAIRVFELDTSQTGAAEGGDAVFEKDKKKTKKKAKKKNKKKKKAKKKKANDVPDPKEVEVDGETEFAEGLLE